jgi:hypothetical protein
MLISDYFFAQENATTFFWNPDLSFAILVTAKCFTAVYMNTSLNFAVECLEILLLIREIPGLKLGQETSVQSFSRFSQSHQTNTGIMTVIMPWPHPSMQFSVHE